MPAVKFGKSRQVVIPKQISEALGLLPGDYLEADLKGGKVILTPKVLVDKAIEKGIAEGLRDIKEGRVTGPFNSAEDMIRSLRGTRTPKKRSAQK